MNRTRQAHDRISRREQLAALLALALLAAAPAWAQNFSVDWHTVDGGGEVLSETTDQQWRLSGTLGQPDATELIKLGGDGWTLTGGFWPVNIEQTELLFRDGYEGEAAPQR